MTINTDPNNRPYNEEAFRKTVQRRTIMSFVLFALFFAGIIGLRQWIISQPLDSGALRPFRNVLNANGDFFSHFSAPDKKAPAYTKAQAAKQARVNGNLGMDSELDPAGFRLKVVPFGKKDTMYFTMSDIRSLPHQDVIFNFKCIEGWSQVSHWGGVKLYDFLKKYKLGSRSLSTAPERDELSSLPDYVGMETPDHQYYVGLDMKSALHDQTILCYELNDRPLPAEQGAPLRLIIPTKYGIKHIKRLGTIFFSDVRPRDYWAEQGYDWDSSL